MNKRLRLSKYQGICLKLNSRKLEVLDSFELYVSKGGNIISFADYYIATNNWKEFEPEKHVIILALCEELAIAGNSNKIFEILSTVFHLERWTLTNFKRFMACVKDSDLLRPYYDGIFALHENCKNYMKSM
jgi:hypothetical protein